MHYEFTPTELQSIRGPFPRGRAVPHPELGRRDRLAGDCATLIFHERPDPVGASTPRK